MGEPRGQGTGPSGIAGTPRGPWGPGWDLIMASTSLGPSEVAFRCDLQACALTCLRGAGQPAGSLSTPSLPQVTSLSCHGHSPSAESGPSTGTALRFLSFWSSVHRPPAMWTHKGRARAGRSTTVPRPVQGSSWGQSQGRMPAPEVESRDSCLLVGFSRGPLDGPQSLPPQVRLLQVPGPTACPGLGRVAVLESMRGLGVRMWFCGQFQRSRQGPRFPVASPVGLQTPM